MIQAACVKLPEDQQLAVASLVVEDTAGRYPKADAELKSRIERIGWKIEDPNGLHFYNASMEFV